MFCLTLLFGALFAIPAFAISESEVEAQVAASGKEAVVGNVLIWFLCAVAFLKISQKIDSFMQSIGLNVGHTGGSLMAEALIATRGIRTLAGLGGHASGGAGGGASSLGDYFKGGLVGMASRRAADNAVRTATSNTTIRSPHTSSTQSTREATHNTTQGTGQGAQGPIPAQASTLAQAPRLTDQSKMAPQLDSSPAPEGAASSQSVPIGSDGQQSIILTDSTAPVSSTSDSFADAGPDISTPGVDAAVDSSERTAVFTEQQTVVQGGSTGIIQTATQSSSQSSERTNAQSSNRTTERSSTSNNAARSTHTSSKIIASGGRFRSYGIGGAMFMKSLASGGGFANDVIGRIAQGDSKTTGTISGEMATHALNSYMGITAIGGDARNSPVYSNVEIGGGRISGTETLPGAKEGIQFSMYHTEQYAAPQGAHTKVFTADGASWYKQYAQDSVDRKPYNAPDGTIAYEESIVKRMPNPPQRKSRM